MRQATRRDAGFTLTELAVVMAVVALLLGMGMYTLGAQVEQRNRSDTERRLEEARDLLFGFAIVNGRLPCPATPGTSGDEAPAGGGACTNYYGGFLPARTIGFQPIDAAGYGLDAWGNRIRYAVSQQAIEPTTTSSSCATPLDPAWSMAGRIKANGVGCGAANIVVCDAAQNTNSGVTPPSCGTWATPGDALPVTNQRIVVALVLSTGKNTAVGPAGNDEAENVDGDGVFVWHPPAPAGATGGEFDDHMVWMPVGVLYSRLVAAGVLP